MTSYLRILIQNILNKYIRKKVLITRLIFGVKIIKDQRIQWDFTTLLLKGCLLKHIRPGSKVLEIGTGPYAILSIFLAKHIFADVIACDINETYVTNARKIVILNSVSVKVVHSDLFDNISGPFDIIFFNSIYIPRHVGEKLGIDKLHDNESDWCGGRKGIDTINRFLRNAHFYLKENGKVLLGFNPKYLQEKLVREIYQKCGFILKTHYTSFLNPSCVYILQRRQL